jgi:hypothetical protein
MPMGSNVLGSEALTGRGAIQTLSREVAGLRGLFFLGMLTTNSAESTHPRASAFLRFIRCVGRGSGFPKSANLKILIFVLPDQNPFAQIYAERRRLEKF